ncbi:MAG: hypothetical protein LBL04_11590, partial [Bacteroidales bacterium]|nr:hypothetical protein [Bacteroidales bacterium]
MFIDVSTNGGGDAGIEKLFECFRHDTVYFNYARFIKPLNDDDIIYQPYQSEVFCLPNEAGFNGNLYVLQSELTASAADFFCRMVARNKLGVRIGKSTGS